MTFTEQLNAFFTSPASRTKLITLRAIWRDRYVRDRLICKGERGVNYEKLAGHLKSTNPALVSFHNQHAPRCGPDGPHADPADPSTDHPTAVTPTAVRHRHNNPI